MEKSSKNEALAGKIKWGYGPCADCGQLTRIYSNEITLCERCAFDVSDLPYGPGRALPTDLDEPSSPLMNTANEEEMNTSCPCCNHENCKVREEFMQATRSQPMTSLGFHGYCPDCAVSFRVKTPQLAL